MLEVSAGSPNRETRVLDLPGARFEAVVQGEGQLVVFLHGAGASTLANWQSFFETNHSGLRLLGINLPGAGSTRWEATSIDVERLVDHLLAVLDNFEPLAPIKLVGYSTGALLAIAVASRLGTRATHLVVAAPWVSPDAQSRLFFGLWSQLLESDRELFGKFNALVAFSNGFLGRLDDATVQYIVKANTPEPSACDDLIKLIRMNQTADVGPYLASLAAKTTVIAFKHDHMVPARHASNIATAIAGSRLVELDAGHGGPWEMPDVFSLAIRESLAFDSEGVLE